MSLCFPEETQISGYFIKGSLVLLCPGLSRSDQVTLYVTFMNQGHTLMPFPLKSFSPDTEQQQLFLLLLLLKHFVFMPLNMRGGRK